MIGVDCNLTHENWERLEAAVARGLAAQPGATRCCAVAIASC